MKAWNAPALVSNVAIDAKDSKVTLAENATITDLAKANDAVRWTQLDGALPFPIDLKDPVTELAVRSSDIVAALDQEVVKVTGLEADNFTLTIDGEPVGTFTKAQLAEGVNLATLATPMSSPGGSSVHALTLKHNAMHHTRWRTIHVPNQSAKPETLARALEGLDLGSKPTSSRSSAPRPSPSPTPSSSSRRPE